MKLENWEKRIAVDGGFADPNDPSMIFEGDVYDLPGVPDGTRIKLTDLIGYDFAEFAFVTEDGRWMRPSEASKIYKIRYPEAEKKLWSAINTGTIFKPAVKFGDRYMFSNGRAK